jgi:hypothetical protein
MNAASGAGAHPAPHKDRVGFAALLFGACTAPIFWLGQVGLGYGLTAWVCFPGDHPQPLSPDLPLSSALVAFDIVAFAASVAGGVVAWWAWRQTKNEKEGGERHALHTGEGRTRFMALWGIMSSLWFAVAILFNTIASITVPPCLN